MPQKEEWLIRAPKIFKSIFFLVCFFQLAGCGDDEITQEIETCLNSSKIFQFNQLRFRIERKRINIEIDQTRELVVFDRNMNGVFEAELHKRENKNQKAVLSDGPVMVTVLCEESQGFWSKYRRLIEDFLPARSDYQDFVAKCINHNQSFNSDSFFLELLTSAECDQGDDGMMPDSIAKNFFDKYELDSAAAKAFKAAVPNRIFHFTCDPKTQICDQQLPFVTDYDLDVIASAQSVMLRHFGLETNYQRGSKELINIPNEGRRDWLLLFDALLITMHHYGEFKRFLDRENILAALKVSTSDLPKQRSWNNMLAYAEWLEIPVDDFQRFKSDIMAMNDFFSKLIPKADDGENVAGRPD